MDLVLGLSMTSADVRWVLVEGTTAEGATICRDAVDFDTLDDVIVAVGDNRLHAVGVTWANQAQDAASTLLDALADRGLANVITVSEQEAADALALGLADRGGYQDLAVCVVEPDGAVIAMVDADGVTTERVIATADDVFAVLDSHAARPEAIFVLGSAADLDTIAASFEGAGVPVITAAEADLVLARGAALAAAKAVNTLDARPVRWRMPSRIGALTSVVAAAVVVFVVSLSAALGLGLTPDEDSTVAQQPANAEQPARLPAAPPPARAAPQPIPAVPPPAPPPPPPVAQTIVEAAAPLPDVPDAIPEIAPPPAALPPEPANVPPPPPAYVPPAPNYVPPVPTQPRLRDRIIERIPIINRFHGN